MELLSYLQMFKNISSTNGLFEFIVGGFLAFLLILWIYSKIMQGVDAAKKDVDEDKGNVKGCIQILGYLFVAWFVYFMLSNL